MLFSVHLPLFLHSCKFSVIGAGRLHSISGSSEAVMGKSIGNLSSSVPGTEKMCRIWAMTCSSQVIILKRNQKV